CVAGKEALYAYCVSRGISVNRCGKLIVATDQAQVAGLHRLQSMAAKNGVSDLRFLTGLEAKAIEPDIRCVAALLSPSTGVVDSHSLMLSLQGDAENAGAISVFHSPFSHGKQTSEGIEISIAGETTDT